MKGLAVRPPRACLVPARFFWGGAGATQSLRCVFFPQNFGFGRWL